MEKLELSSDTCRERKREWEERERGRESEGEREAERMGSFLRESERDIERDRARERHQMSPEELRSGLWSPLKGSPPVCVSDVMAAKVNLVLFRV